MGRLARWVKVINTIEDVIYNYTIVGHLSRTYTDPTHGSRPSVRAGAHGVVIAPHTPVPHPARYP